jgi:hypothetical protein
MGARRGAVPHRLSETASERRRTASRIVAMPKGSAYADGPARLPLQVRVSDIFFVLRPGEPLYEEEYAFAVEQFVRHGVPMPYEHEDEDLADTATAAVQVGSYS